MRAVSGAIIFGALGYLAYGAWAAVVLATLAGATLVRMEGRSANNLLLHLESATRIGDTSAREIVRGRLQHARLTTLQRHRVQLSDVDEALRLGDIDRAEHLLASLRPETRWWSTSSRYHLILKESRLAVVAAARGDAAGAKASIARVHESAFATSNAIAKAELAHTVLLDRLDDDEGLRIQVERARERMWLAASTSDLAILSHHRRRLASKTLGSAYRGMVTPQPREREATPSRPTAKDAPGQPERSSARAPFAPPLVTLLIVGVVAFLNGGPLYWVWPLVLFAVLWLALIGLSVKRYRNDRRYNDASRLVALERLGEAERILEEIVSSGRDPIRDHIALLAMLRLERGDPDAALATKHLWRGAMHGHDWCGLAQALALAWLDRGEEARSAADVLLQVPLPDARLVEAILLAREGELERAAAAVVDLDPDAPGRPVSWSLLLASLRSVGAVVNDAVEERLLRDELERSPERRAWLESIAPLVVQRLDEKGRTT